MADDQSVRDLRNAMLSRANDMRDLASDLTPATIDRDVVLGR